jgi:poly(3-hydroxyalkanoate) synthetase
MAEVKTRQPVVRPEIAAARGVALRSTPIAIDSSAAPRQILAAAATSVPTTNLLQELLGYQRDLFERTILFWDTLRQRADDMIAHERAGKPPLLDFDYEMLLDARRFERPANYALLRISRIGDVCFEDCVDSSKPPVIIVDPRAGHGPGIGGFRRESEVGMAMHEGHTVYFVTFFPEPCPGQTLADVLHALRRFIEEVTKRHPGTPPILYGNCQAGWAITLLCADCEGLVGPAVLNGSPLSYWAGESGTNPMRIAGGMVGGVWLTHLLADLGDGRFDGAWLVSNFENLKPESVLEKYAGLLTNIDTERDRFLEFERWWNAWYFLSREEIVSIVENLFIGNRLEEGKFRICEGCTADLRRIHNPLVIFASYGDDITPPHQALDWIPTVYKDAQDLKAAGQRIVYLTNPHVGHLGIFVSAKIARLEHRAILESLSEIDALAPGLYEMKIDNPSGDPDCHKPAYSVRFEERQVQDIKVHTPHKAFERVRQVSEANEQIYKTFLSPLIRSLANPATAALLEWLHPMRTSRYLLSESFSQWMRAITALARTIEQHRTPLPADNAFIASERSTSEQISKAIEEARKRRDAAEEQIFAILYGAGQSPASRSDPAAARAGMP